MSKTDDSDEPRVRFFSNMPDGYVFVTKGDVFVTKNCRLQTHDAGRTLYVVVDKANKVLGLRCPAEIYAAVEAENKATAGRRAEAVQKRDAVVHGKFEADILRLYPKTPAAEIPKIVSHALKKRSRRVGTRTTIDTDKKVGLAVRAHIRHCHTKYHMLLQTTGNREKARAIIFDQVKEIELSWGAQPSKVDRRQAVGHKSARKMKAGKGSSPATGRRVQPNAPATKINPPRRAATMRRTRGSTSGAKWIEVDGVVELVDDSEDEAVETDSESSEESDWSEYSDI
ncbi:hypothetical protein QBC37DRAFT_415082 [Rhypophila decipiens]|uniref:DUF2293 domain-containing protein n=1 Tax=Rhypophila decipiens TaxID=261697 RepID=A0AAN7BBN4_9PEZI|nr:hypothetical protein QBC37DRAFT_415082 [Rhypophila decipiens]